MRLGALVTVLLAPPAVIVLVATDFGGISTGDFVLYKAILGVALGAVVTPLIALWAMSDGIETVKAGKSKQVGGRRQIDEGSALDPCMTEAICRGPRDAPLCSRL